jgi:DNA-binding transcriptional MerR regulator
MKNQAGLQITIGRIAEAVGCKVQTIRYYEQIGLLARPERSSGNQRIYGRADMDRLAFIRHARDLGFPIEAIRDLLSLSDRPDQPCEAADTIARVQLVHVERRIEQLLALKLELQRMITQCSGGRISNCRVIEVLGDHGKCVAHGDKLDGVALLD